MTSRRRIILSCEHAGNRVPKRYQPIFAKTPDVLQTHRGYDIGIAAVAKQMQKRLDCPLCLYPWTRLLIDVNRTRPGALFSDFSRTLPKTDKEHLIEKYYRPYVEGLEQAIRKNCAKTGVLHLSLHSFTPVLEGQERNADIGILYDPRRKQEASFAAELQRRLRQKSGLRIRRNYPYAGRADGMTAWFRRKFTQAQYLGIEIELNQAILSSKALNDIVTLLTNLL